MTSLTCKVEVRDFSSQLCRAAGVTPTAVVSATVGPSSNAGTLSSSRSSNVQSSVRSGETALVSSPSQAAPSAGARSSDSQSGASAMVDNYVMCGVFYLGFFGLLGVLGL